MTGVLKYLKTAAQCVLTAALASACAGDVFNDFYGTSSERFYGSSEGTGMPVREVTVSSRNVLLLYSAGFNDLSSALEDDVNDLKSGYIPRPGSHSILLVFSRRVSGNSYSNPSPAHLIRLYSGTDGTVISDTLRTWPAGTVAASATTMREVLTYINSIYPKARTGMIFSSHASGWLPKGFYSTGVLPSYSVARRAAAAPEMPVPYIEPEYAPGEPMVKSIGVDNASNSSAYEMEIEDLASAIPEKLDYIIMDACLMGGIETAYALKDKCGKLVFSQAEVMADGLCDYTSLGKRLLEGPQPDLQGLCDDSYNHYSAPGFSKPYLTLSMVDCSALDGLAGVCRGIFNDNRALLSSVNPSDVQGYFRFNKHWFYDMEDILVKAGIPSDKLADFRAALDDCIMYKASTPTFISIEIKTFCGLSMYLPANGSQAIDNFYKTLSWNKATSLVP
ncbi:MAG: clostripain-related cysteine peptidase [Bacteroidales bacterium]|nr:clostripain-related cysteine peptidase [Bacteroidales bacterium]